MRVNSFKCSNCGGFTRHVEISSREMAAIDGETGVMGNVLAGTIGDFFGLRHITRNVSGIVPYKCCNCGRCAWRNSAGEDKQYIGYSK